MSDVEMQSPAVVAQRLLLPRSTAAKALAIAYLLLAGFGYWMLISEGGESSALFFVLGLPLTDFMYHALDIPLTSWLYALVPPLQIVVACVVVHAITEGIRRAFDRSRGGLERRG